MREFYVYILHCADQSYYIGVTNNFELRIEQHQMGYNPDSYTFERRPVKLVHVEVFGSILDAIHREKQLKRWSRRKKQALVQGNEQDLILFSKRRKVIDRALSEQ